MGGDNLTAVLALVVLVAAMIVPLVLLFRQQKTQAGEEEARAAVLERARLLQERSATRMQAAFRSYKFRVLDAPAVTKSWLIAQRLNEARDDSLQIKSAEWELERAEHQRLAEHLQAPHDTTHRHDTRTRASTSSVPS